MISDKSARDLLALMLFRNDDLPKTIDMLSGGEKARVRLAQFWRISQTYWCWMSRPITSTSPAARHSKPL